MDLRNLIMKSTNYEEELVMKLLSTVMNERIERKKVAGKKAEQRTFQLEKQRLQLQLKENKNPEDSVKSSTEFNSKV